MLQFPGRECTLTWLDRLKKSEPYNALALDFYCSLAVFLGFRYAKLG